MIRFCVHFYFSHFVQLEFIRGSDVFICKFLARQQMARHQEKSICIFREAKSINYSSKVRSWKGANKKKKRG